MVKQRKRRNQQNCTTKNEQDANKLDDTMMFFDVVFCLSFAAVGWKDGRGLNAIWVNIEIDVGFTMAC